MKTHCKTCVCKEVEEIIHSQETNSVQSSDLKTEKSPDIILPIDNKQTFATLKAKTFDYCCIFHIIKCEAMVKKAIDDQSAEMEKIKTQQLNTTEFKNKVDIPWNEGYQDALKDIKQKLGLE